MKQHISIIFIAASFLSFSSQAENLAKGDLEKTDAILSISSPAEACKKFKGKLLTNEEHVYYFKDCSLHLITDVQLINTLIQTQNKTPVNMNRTVYAALPVGKNYEYADYYAEYVGENSAYTCKNLNKKIISLDDYNFYYIENCKKRKFENQVIMQEFNTSNEPVYSVSQFEFNSFPKGLPITAKIIDTKEISENKLQNKAPHKHDLCKGLNNKVTAFHESFYYVEKCKLHAISTQNFTLSLQERVQEMGGVKDLTVEQVLGLEEGKEMTSADEVISKLR